jgi:hypothetical protein
LVHPRVRRNLHFLKLFRDGVVEAAQPFRDAESRPAHARRVNGA